MSDDWQDGDLALCIKLSPWRGSKSGRAPNVAPPKPGGIYTVAYVGLSTDGILGFELSEVENHRNPNGTIALWSASRFRKIHPHQPDAEDIETIYQLNRERVPALGES